MDPNLIQALLAPIFLLIGLSHLIQPRLWVRFFQRLERTELAAAIIPMYTLPVGLLLIVGHNIWIWDWPLFLTIAGWMMTLKSALYLLIPIAADRMLASRLAKTERSYQVAGAIIAFFGGALTFQAWR